MSTDVTTIYIIRHGETDNNLRHRFIGSTDNPLNARGMAQAACLREPMARLRPDKIYSSPYMRTMMTAEQVLGDRTDIAIIPEKGIREIHCGEWEGKNREEIEALWPGMINLWQYEPDKLRMPGGETFAQVQARGVKAFCDIVARERGKSVAVVSHMLTIQLIMAELLSVPIRDVWNMTRLENTSITTMKIFADGKFEVEKWGDVSHISEELQSPFVRIAGFVTKDFVPAYDVSKVEGRHEYKPFAIK